MPWQVVSEDVALWTAIGAAGLPCIGTSAIPVRTSARHDARAPGGFAALLDRLGGDG